MRASVHEAFSVLGFDFGFESTLFFHSLPFSLLSFCCSAIVEGIRNRGALNADVLLPDCFFCFLKEDWLITFRKDNTGRATMEKLPQPGFSYFN